MKSNKLAIIILLIFTAQASAFTVAVTTEGIQDITTGETGDIVINATFETNENIGSIDFKVTGLPFGDVAFQLNDIGCCVLDYLYLPDEQCTIKITNQTGFICDLNHNLIPKDDGTGGNTTASTVTVTIGLDTSGALGTYTPVCTLYVSEDAKGCQGEPFTIGEKPDPECEDGTEGYICFGFDLWCCDCIDGVWVQDVLIETNSPECGYVVDPCEGVVCSNVCVDLDLWSQICVDGTCMPDEIIEENSSVCNQLPERRSGSGRDGTYPPGWDDEPTNVTEVESDPKETTTETATEEEVDEEVEESTTEPEVIPTTTEYISTQEMLQSWVFGIPGFNGIFMVLALLGAAFIMTRKKQ